MDYTPESLPLIGHRGVTSRGPENSISALAAAVDISEPRLTGVEIDIHSTADGQIILHHDPVTAGGRVIAESSLAELRRERLSDGSLIPLLSEALAVLGTLDVYVEAKGLDESADRELLRVLHDGPNPEGYYLHSFDHRVIKRLRGLDTAFGYGVLSCSYPVFPERQCRDAGASILWQQWQLIDTDLIRRCEEASLEVIAWTVPVERASDLLALGVAGICLDA